MKSVNYALRACVAFPVCLTLLVLLALIGDPMPRWLEWLVDNVGDRLIDWLDGAR